MPRHPRVAQPGFAYHVLNRAIGRAQLFRSQKDYAAFEHVLFEARERFATPLLAWCVMPNHWHLVLWPRKEGELSEFMRWLTVTHTQRWHASHRTSGTGPLYQGRFKSFPIEDDDHLLAVVRYVERNALRANLVARAEEWRWSSLPRRWSAERDKAPDAGPLTLPSNWASIVNRPETEAELERLRRSVVRGAPFGDVEWQRRTAEQLGLQSTLNPRGRPRIRSKLQTTNDSRPL
jgi:putative transposase